MKKILMGLVALSSLSFAGTTALEKPAAEGSDVFLGGQIGKIALQATLQTKATDVKYVVYASADNGTTKEDVWNIGAITISTDSPLIANAASLPKLYVKKVSGSTTEELVGETVGFKPEFDAAYTGLNGRMDYINAPNTSDVVNPFAFVTQAEITALVGSFGFSSDDQGNIKLTESGEFYLPIQWIKFSSPSNGVFEIFSENNNATNVLLPEKTQQVENAFRSGVASTGVSVNVRVQ